MLRIDDEELRQFKQGDRIRIVGVIDYGSRGKPYVVCLSAELEEANKKPCCGNCKFFSSSAFELNECHKNAPSSGQGFAKVGAGGCCGDHVWVG
jgi:hypothetical protein